MANGLLLGNVAQSFNDGYDRGRQLKFNALAGQTIADPSNTDAIGAAASIDPGRALSLQQGVQASQDAYQKKLAGAASYLLNAYKSGNPAQTEGAYQAVRPYLDRLGQQLGQGPASPHFTEEMLPHLYQIVGQAGGDTAINGQIPTGLRELQGQLTGAGIAPGSPEAQKAYRVALGLDPRAVTGAAKTGMITGADGRERPYTFDPSTGRYSVFDGGSWQPLGAQESAQLDAAGAGGAGGPPAGNPGTSAAPKPTVADLTRQATQMANQGGPGKNQAAAQQWLYGQLDRYGYRPLQPGQGVPTPPSVSATSPSPSPAPNTGGLGVGRAPEDTERAKQDATNASNLAVLPETEKIKNDAAVDRARREAQAKGEVDRQLNQPQAQASLNDASSNLDRLATTATRLMQHPGLTGITSWQARVPDIPGSDAANARAELQTLRSQVGFGVLQAMRNASKTGGALGSVSDAEGARLENNLAALEQSQSPQAFKENLQRIVDYANQAKGRLNTAYQQAYGGQGSSGTIQAGHVEGGYRFKGGDPGNQANWEKI